MAVTRFQADILSLLAQQRRERGESYVAGGVALNILLSEPRRSRDIDLFHDTEEALSATWSADRAVLLSQGFSVSTLREVPSFIEAMVSRGDERTAMQWARDSAYRFFPLMEDDLMGLALHPLDLATNKVLAMAGRLEVRDWVDVLNCDRKLQPYCKSMPSSTMKAGLVVPGRESSPARSAPPLACTTKDQPFE